jgi:transposase
MSKYPSNLSKEEFIEIEPYLPIKKTTKPRKWTNHEILNGIMYVLVSGCQWRMLPVDFPPWETVYYYFNTWKKEGVIDLILKKIGKKVSFNAGKRYVTDKGYY